MKKIVYILMLFTSAATGQVNMNAGLQAYYPFSGNANDVSGNNNNPTFNNATPAPDRFGNPNSAYSFNGSSSYMQIPNSPSINTTNQISLCAWVKVNGFYSGNCHGNSILMKGNTDYLPGNYLLRFDDNAYTNGQNCSTPVVDLTHQNFYGVNTSSPGSPYIPYINTSQWFSVVYTSDGTTSSLYVNCELKKSAPAGSLTFTNAHDLFLGKLNNSSFPYWFNGIMDEVRIYNRAINADEVKAYGDCSLLTTGTNIGNIINNYTPVIDLLPCENKITVEDAGSFNTGDTVLIIQMKGAVVDSTNTSSFGAITDYKNAGNYEINYVKSKTGNIIELKNILTRQYDIPAGKVQLVRVPYYQNANITSTLTCAPWDGNKGGVLVLNVLDTINLTANIDVSGKGFAGGTGFNSQIPVLNCFQNNYYYPQSSNSIAGQKGESISLISSNINYGKGGVANGGGGGLGHNSGGGGGANGGNGGMGGYSLDNCGNSPFDNRGLGGKLLNYSSATNKIFLGGGGGAGQADNPGNIPPGGGGGGGIAIIICNKLKVNNNRVIANGNDAVTCSIPTSPDCHDSMGGGGAGGTLLLSINQFLDNISIENKGGKGADMVGSVSLGGRIGGGGGGGGGLLYIKSPSLPSSVLNNNIGGLNGVLTQDGNNSWGATPGQPGNILFNLQIPIDNTPFRPNIDSVRIKDSLITCDNFDFKGLAFTNTNPVSSWQWYFGDGGTASTQNANHTYAPGNYTVKLVVTDINGCKDSILTNITASILTMDAGPADTVCAPASSQLLATATGATQYQWSPAIYLNNPSILNPIATPPATTMFYLNATNTAGCSKTDSVLITVRAANAFSINPPEEICELASTQLTATGGDIYAWQPSGSLNNSAINNPVASPAGTTTYTVLITDTLCGNSTQLSTLVTVNPDPVITASRSNDVNCTTPNSTLNASGGVQYAWTPAGSLSNPAIASPVATPASTTLYTVTGTDAKGCSNTDTITVKVSTENKGGYQMATAFTPNNDGLNDCYGIKYWGVVTEVEFSIYNRWGERIFFSRNPNACWDGTYKGVTQDPGVFVYMIKAKTTCEPSVFRKGTFALIR